MPRRSPRQLLTSDSTEDANASAQAFSSNGTLLLGLDDAVIDVQLGRHHQCRLERRHHRCLTRLRSGRRRIQHLRHRCCGSGFVNWISVTDANLDFLDAGETITLTTVTITDNNNDTDTDTVQVTITGTNDAPQISAAIADFGFTEDANASAQALSSNGALSFTDLDDAVSMSARPSPPMPSGAAPSMPHSPPLWKPDSTSKAPMLRLRVHRWTYSVTDANLDFLDAGETITLTYTVTITNNNNDTDTDTVQVTITGTNDAPQISAAIADFGFTEDANASAQALSSNGALSFTDLDDNAVIDVSSAVTTNAVWSGGTIDASLASALEAGFNISGTDVAAPGSVNWTTPSPTPTSTPPVPAKPHPPDLPPVTITDNNNDTDTDTVQVTITGTNDAPQISAAIADFGFTEDANASAQALSSNGALSFTDLDDNAVIDVSSAVTTNAVWSGGTIDASLASALEAGFNISGTDVAAPGSSTGPTPSPTPTSTSSMPAKPSP